VIRPVHCAWIVLTGLMLSFMAPVHALGQEEGEEQEGPDAARRAMMERSQRPRLDVVQARRFYKAKRLEVFPHAYSGALNNSFATRFLVLSGLGVAFHLRETLFLEGSFHYFPDYPFFSDLKQLNYAIAQYAPEDPNTKKTYIPDVSKETFYVGAAVGFAPIYGKINLLSSYVQSFDVAFLAGVGLLGIRADRYVVTFDDSGVLSLGDPESYTTTPYLAPHLGLTTRFFLSRLLTLRLDARMHGYVTQVPDYNSEPLSDNTYPLKSSLKGSFILTAGVSGFLPIR